MIEGMIAGAIFLLMIAGMLSIKHHIDGMKKEVPEDKNEKDESKESDA
jgi:hypothetical protein